MYQIVKDETVIATATNLKWIQKQGDYFIPCSESKAQGVVVDGIPYHITGRNGMEGVESVLITEIDEIRYNAELELKHLQSRADIDYISIMTEVEL